MSPSHTLKSVIGNAEDTTRRVGLSENEKERIREEREKLRVIGNTEVEKAVLLMSEIAGMALAAQGKTVDIELTK